MKNKKQTIGALGLAIVVANSGCGASTTPGGSSTSASTSYSFALKGSVGSTTTANLASLFSNPSSSRLFSGLGTTATHVIAVNPGSGSGDRQVSAIGTDGSFSLNIQGGRPWLLVFVNQNGTLKGSNMIVGVMQSSDSSLGGNTLHTLAPSKTTGSADLGTVSFGGTSKTASSSTSFSTLLSSLSLDSTTATTLAKSDGICLRYLNPDMDGDGLIDVSQTNRNFLLDFHTRFDVKFANGTQVSPQDMVNKFVTDTAGVTASFSSLSPYVSWSTSFFPNVPTTAVLTTQDTSGATLHTYNYSAMTTLSFSNNVSVGPNLTGAADSGTYALSLGTGNPTITFTNVQALTTTQLTQNDGRIMPFLKFNTDTGAVGGHLTSIDYKWMKYSTTSVAWIAATLAEVQLLTNDNGGTAGIYDSDYARSASKTFSLTIPNTAISGTIQWALSSTTSSGSSSPAITLSSGLTNADFTNMTGSKICDLGLSYDDKLGMRIFSNVKASCTP